MWKEEGGNVGAQPSLPESCLLQKVHLGALCVSGHVEGQLLRAGRCWPEGVGHWNTSGDNSPLRLVLE